MGPVLRAHAVPDTAVEVSHGEATPVTPNVPPLRVDPDGRVVARIGPPARPWVALRGDRERGPAYPDHLAGRWPAFVANLAASDGPLARRARDVSRETCPR